MKGKGGGSQALGWMSGVSGRAKGYICVLLLIQALLGVSSVGYAMLLREIVDAAVDGEREAFFAASALFAGLVALQIALRAVSRFFEEYARSTMENKFKGRLFEALLKREYGAVTQVNSGEWMNRLTSDTVVVADGLTQILPGVAGMAVKLAGALAAILFLQPEFIYILLPGGLILIFFTYGFRKVLKKLHKAIQEADGRLRVFLQERLGSLMVVRAFAQEEASAKQAAGLMDGHRAARMRRNHFSNLCNIGFGTAMHGAYVLGAVFCGYGILTGTMSYGSLMAILQLISQIQNPFANITGYLPKYYAMLASAERLMEAERFARDLGGQTVPEEERQAFYQGEFLGLGMRGVSYAYLPPVSVKGEAPAMPVVLKNFCLEIRLTHQGEQAFAPRWRSLFAYVPQGNQLMSGTIREIIAFGEPQKMRQEEAMRRALRIACADGFVDGLEQGLDTLLGERGMGISEGQMQRIAIARAIFSGRPILLLDEATSSLDEETEAKLLQNLRAMTDQTVVIVTHRPAVLSICDKHIAFT